MAMKVGTIFIKKRRGTGTETVKQAWVYIQTPHKYHQHLGTLGGPTWDELHLRFAHNGLLNKSHELEALYAAGTPKTLDFWREKMRLLSDPKNWDALGVDHAG